MGTYTIKGTLTLSIPRSTRSRIGSTIRLAASMHASASLLFPDASGAAPLAGLSDSRRKSSYMRNGRDTSITE